MKSYVVLDKQVGETPLSCAEAWRGNNPEYAGIPLAYAGRLDPMASGKLLILIGDECKNQTNYHNLDKAYEFSILLGVGSDTLDVLGRLETSSKVPVITPEEVGIVIETFVGDIELPYPKFSAKTVHGKPLHMWTLENRLGEITIPTKESTIYSLTFNRIETISRKDLVAEALKKINSIPEVTDPRKAMGNDFRRVDVRSDWQLIATTTTTPRTPVTSVKHSVLDTSVKHSVLDTFDRYSIVHFTCIASSGTYMRTLAIEIAKKLGTIGLAFSIHRTHIGAYDPVTKTWTNEYT